MAVIQKTLFAKNLDKYSVLVNDTDPNSKYFKVTELPDTLTGGKNAFLIAGSDLLVADTKILIEIKSSDGKIIYNEPGEGYISSSLNGVPFVTEYYEGVSKVVSVYVYPDTSFGECTITILGEVNQYEDGNGMLTPIPLDWEGKYNVKWQKTINVNPSLANTTKIRFYERPTANITEILSPIYRIISGSKVDSGTNQSFANIKLSKLETFAGDVKRVKVFRTSEGDISDYSLIQDILVEAKELLTSYNLSGSVIGNTGIFTSETLTNFWNTGSLNVYLTSSRIESGIALNGSGLFTYTSSLDIKSTNTYELNLDAFYSSSISSNLGIYLFSALTGSSIATLNGTAPTKNLSNIVIPFKIDTDYPSASLYFSQSQGEWHLGNISLKLSQDTAFSPDEISFVTTMPTIIGNETYNFKFEFYDVNNNYVPVAATQSATFTGGTNTSNTTLLISASLSQSLAALAIVSSSISGTMTIYSSSASSSVAIVSGSVFNLSGSVSTSVQLLTGSISSSLSSSYGFTSGSIYTLSGSVSSSQSALSASISRSVYNSLTQSFTYVQSLANGNYSGSFISGNIIYAPVIGGQLGYFSTLFKVGQSPNSIYLDARQTPRKIFIGGAIPSGDTEYSGAYNNTNTNVYLDSAGKFSLGNQLSFDGSNLTVNGTINVAGGNAATNTSVATAAGNAATSASNAQTTANNALSGVASVGAYTSSIFTNSSGQINKTPSPTASGLYLGSTYLGYYNGSDWKTYMANNGNFYLSGAGTDSLSWASGVLTINGAINITGGNVQTSLSNINSATSSLNSSVSTINSSITNINTATSSLDARIFTNSSGLVNKTPSASTSGLYLGSTFLGYYNGSAWKTYMDNAGKFYLSGTGTNGLSWDGSSLSITGVIKVSDGTEVTNATITGAASGATALQNSDTGKSLGLTGGSVGGVTIASNKIYVGTGTYGNANTGFYVDSSGNMSLKDKLVWDGSTLSITGNITVSGGNAATTTQVSTAQTTADNAASAASTAQSTANGKISTGGAASDVNSGVTKISGGQITADTITATQISSLNFTGKTATFDTGKIGGWDLTSTGIQSTDTFTRMRSDNKEFAVMESANVNYYKVRIGAGTTFKTQSFHPFTEINESGIKVGGIVDTNGDGLSATLQGYNDTANSNTGVSVAIYNSFDYTYNQYVGVYSRVIANNSGVASATAAGQFEGGISVRNTTTPLATDSVNQGFAIITDGHNYFGGVGKTTQIANPFFALSDVYLRGLALNPSGAGTNYTIKADTLTNGKLFQSSSSRKTKNIYGNWKIGGVLENIKKVPVKRFKYKNWADDEVETFGLIAEDLHNNDFWQSVIYDADKNNKAIYTEETVAGIDYEKVTSILWKGMQELLQKVEDLETQLKNK
jgi:hypothetical protein